MKERPDGEFLAPCAVSRPFERAPRVRPFRTWASRRVTRWFERCAKVADACIPRWAPTSMPRRATSASRRRGRHDVLVFAVFAIWKEAK